MEIDEENCKNLPDDFINTSNAKGRKRYQTDDLRDLIEELEEAEVQFKDALVPFLRTMFKKFYDNREIFTRAVQCVAELDCLCALSIISSFEDFGPMCRP